MPQLKIAAFFIKEIIKKKKKLPNNFALVRCFSPDKTMAVR